MKNIIKIDPNNIEFFIKDLPADIIEKPLNNITSGEISTFIIQNTSDIGEVCTDPTSVTVSIYSFDKVKTITCP